MQRRKLILVRGLPGSGKSTFARSIAGPYAHWEADMYFQRTFDEHGEVDGYDGPYEFDPAALPDAHQWCLDMVEQFMDRHRSTVVVANTFSRLWEMQGYHEIAYRKDWDVTVFHMKGNWGSIHNVPEHVIEEMAERWESCDGEVVIDPRIVHHMPRYLGRKA